MDKKIRAFLKHQIKTDQETLISLSNKIGIGYGTLYRYLEDGSVGTIRVKESIESYYNKASKQVSA